MRKMVLLLLLLCCKLSFSQLQLSSEATASVLTGGVGDELYTAFGHSAFRIQDRARGIDRVYNYGTFDTSQPNFYFNFVKGKMTYVLSRAPFDYFLREYKYFGRSVKIQQLNLSREEVQELYTFLENNALPQNRAYQYDFYYENCSTKIESVLKELFSEKVHFYNHHIKTAKTHRELLTDYTKFNFPWAGFGIDLVLGASNDKEATKDEYKFLPDYLYKSLENATIIKDSLKEPLVLKSAVILPETHKKSHTSFTPFWVLLLLSGLILFFTYKDVRVRKRTRTLDFILHLFTGVVGVIILLLWLGTNHTTTYSNFNILWTFAPNIIMAFMLLRKRVAFWFIWYFRVLLLGILGLFVLWILGVQQFHIALLPFLLSLFIRYYVVIRLVQRQQMLY